MNTHPLARLMFGVTIFYGVDGIRHVKQVFHSEDGVSVGELKAALAEDEGIRDCDIYGARKGGGWKDYPYGNGHVLKHCEYLKCIVFQ